MRPNRVCELEQPLVVRVGIARNGQPLQRCCWSTQNISTIVIMEFEIIAEEQPRVKTVFKIISVTV